MGLEFRSLNGCHIFRQGEQMIFESILIARISALEDSTVDSAAME